MIWFRGRKNCQRISENRRIKRSRESGFSLTRYLLWCVYDVSALNSYATKSELTASKNGYPGVKTIKSLSSAGQLTQAGSYHFEAITADVNKDAGTEIFSEYNMGDFYALLLGEDSNSNDGCNFGTLLIASPRINNGIWICTIWQKKMIHWYKIAKISTD